MTTLLATSSLLLTTPWYVATVFAMLTNWPSHEWSVMTSLLSHVLVVVHPVCFIAFSERWRSGSVTARRRVGRMSVCPTAASMRLTSLSGGDRPSGRVTRTCRLHSAPECTIRSMLPGQFQRTTSPATLGLDPIEEYSQSQSQSQGRSTSGTSPAVHRISPRISSATPVDEAPSPVSERLQLSPVTVDPSPTDSGLCPTPLQQRPSPASSPRSSPNKLERFFGEQLRAVDDLPPRDVTSAAPITSSPRARSLSPCSAFSPATPAELGGVQTTPRDSKIITTTTHQQSTLSAPVRHRPVDVHQLSYVACE